MNAKQSVICSPIPFLSLTKRLTDQMSKSDIIISYYTLNLVELGKMSSIRRFISEN